MQGTEDFPVMAEPIVHRTMDVALLRLGKNSSAIALGRDEERGRIRVRVWSC